MSTSYESGRGKKPVNLQGISGQSHSGFVIVRLSPQVIPKDSKRIEEMTTQDGFQGLATILNKYKSANITSNPLVKRTSPSRIKEIEEGSAERKTSHSLTSYWRLDTRKLSSNEITEFVKELRGLQVVESAYRERTATDPVVNASDDPYSQTQTYLDPAPIGIDARYAWTYPNGEGNGIGFVDLEQGWFPNHEDLINKNPTLVFNDNRDGIADYKGNHGAAVLGEVVGVDNNIGIIGIAPGVASVRMASHYEAETDTSGHVADAILAAISLMSPGDVLLLEVQKGLLPTEIEQADFDAIRLATDTGIIVVEAAGNGNSDLDGITDESGLNVLNRNSSDFQDSGAIMVGASVSNVGPDGGHERIEFSNFGSRIDCYAWGENITTCGYGDLDAGSGDDNSYTSAFGGTSGASPIITGAALILQSIYQHLNGKLLTSQEMRSILSNPVTGTPQGPEPGHIGVMPNLRSIIENLSKSKGAKF